MKQLVLLFVSLFLVQTIYAQDIITKKDGVDIKAKVLEVGLSQITYKKFTNLEGPIYTISISDILMITYANGEREVFNVSGNTKQEAAQSKKRMTYNSWSGRVSMGDVYVTNDLAIKYLSPQDYDLYKRGKSLSISGTILGCAGAVPLGIGLGFMSAGEPANVGLLAGGGAAVVLGVVIACIGEANIKTAINNYNSTLAFQPEIHVGSTANGLGLALVF